MKVSERLKEIIAKIETMTEYRHVDIYYCQDQRESKGIPDFPAVLVGIPEMTPLEQQVRNFELKPNFSALVYFDGLTTNAEREYAILDSVEGLCKKITENSRYEVISASCLERTTQLTVWLVEFKFRG